MDVSSSNIYEWKCAVDILNGSLSADACLILNRPIEIPPEIVRQIWQNARLRCLVDGGANRWRQFIAANYGNAETLTAPEFITGDFDSVTKETLAFFSTAETRNIHTPDQDETDFTKALKVLPPFLKALSEDKAAHEFVVLHDTSGRLDQIVANLNTLYKCEKTRVILLSGNSISWLLQPGHHFIHIPPPLVEEKRWCALMPIGEPATSVTTTGLKWNLEDSPMEFGSLVSTSNTYSAPYVEIETRTRLLWSMGIFDAKDD